MTYEYVCTACQHEWEAEQPISASPLTDCPKCEQSTAKRQVSGGAGFILKGGGWYADGYGSPKKDTGEGSEQAAAGKSEGESKSSEGSKSEGESKSSEGSKSEGESKSSEGSKGSESKGSDSASTSKPKNDQSAA